VARPAAGALALLFVVAACSGSASPSSPASPSSDGQASAGPSASSGSRSVPASPVEGLIIAIDSGGLTDVRSITVRTVSGEDITFRVGILDDPVPPAHLNEHMAGALPVLVSFRVEGGELVAYRIDDA